MEFYRYDLYAFNNDPRVFLTVFQLDKETPKGYWIKDKYSLRKWVSKTSRKRYAYPSKKEAMVSLKARTKRRRLILRNQLHNVEQGWKLLQETTI